MDGLGLPMVQNCVEPETSGSGLVRAARQAGLNVENAEQVYRFAALGELRAGTSRGSDRRPDARS